jgi:chromosome segregation ATPase
MNQSELCSELQIDQQTIVNYEDFLGVQLNLSDQYSESQIRIIRRLHNLISQGMGYQDIHQIISFAEQFAHNFSDFEIFAELSPRHRMHEMHKEINSMLTEFKHREAYYKEKIAVNEKSLQEQKNELETVDGLKNKIQTLVVTNRKLENDLAKRDEVLENAKNEFVKLRSELEQAKAEKNLHEKKIQILETQINKQTNNNI